MIGGVSQTQIKIAELRVYSYNRWGLAFFAVAVLVISGVVGRYLAGGGFDIMFWVGAITATGCGVTAWRFRSAENKHITSLEKRRRGGKI